MPTQEQRAKAAELMEYANTNLRHVGMQMELAYYEIERCHEEIGRLRTQLETVKQEYHSYKSGKEAEEKSLEKPVDMAG